MNKNSAFAASDIHAEAKRNRVIALIFLIASAATVGMSRKVCKFFWLD